jgi:uncharacterized protein (TIGR02145 family)
MKLTFLITLLIATLSLSAQTVIKDADGNEYKTTAIDKQVWMAGNLNVTHFLNGDEIPQATTDEAWAAAAKEGKPAWCYYNNDSTNAKYGKLYNYYAITDSRGIAPKGFHVPTVANYQTLVKFLGGLHMAGTKLKHTSGWPAHSNGSTNIGFAGLPAGYRMPSGKFMELGTKTSWWTNSGEIPTASQLYTLSLVSISYETLYLKMDKATGCSVRCIKD